MKAAKSLNITLIPRAEMLSSLMRGFQSIAVAGSHGKTTTTSLIADIFIRANLDPTFIIGGKILGQENKSILGSSEYLIVEADESDASFLHLNPEISVVTNIDNDHLDFYANDLQKLDSTFLQFLENLPFYGNAIICIDSDRSNNVYEKLSRPKISYGFNKKADFYIKELKQNDSTQEFKIVKNSTGKETSIKLALAGRHNALNATAAFIVSQKAGINVKVIKEAFKNFGGVSRRMEHKGEININEKKVKLIDDYGHHPTEIKATIDAVKATNPDKKVSMIFQPHRFSRSIFLFDEFIECLSELDNVIILDIYSAGEQNPKNINAYSFVNALVDNGKNAFFAKNLKEICRHLDSFMQNEEILITQGAGNIVDISNSILAIYK
jgi:UDP-N-acetylmuramate--alanine ligase